MARFHATVNGHVPFTPEEEAEWDAEEAAWAAGENDRLAAAAREERNARIAATDWMVLKAAEVGAVVDPGWIIYRQALREVPQQPSFPSNVTWPTPPAG
jgi:hypothetical protein